MGTSKGGSSTQLQTLFYDEFEPLCFWQRNEAQDTLVLDLPEFKKEQLKIQISSTGVLKIFGERPVKGKRKLRFHKEIKVTKDYNVDNIHAKFSNGQLRVTLPMKIVATPPPMVAPLSPPNQTVPPASIPSLINNVAAEATAGIQQLQDGGSVADHGSGAGVQHGLRSQGFANVAMTVGVAVAMAFSVYVLYNYWFMYLNVDED